jgi:hypothetical protein
MSTAAAVPRDQSRGLHLRRLLPLASAQFSPCQGGKRFTCRAVGGRVDQETKLRTNATDRT